MGASVGSSHLVSMVPVIMDLERVALVTDPEEQKERVKFILKGKYFAFLRIFKKSTKTYS